MSVIYKNKLMLTHGFACDLVITKAYVCNKYVKKERSCYETI